MIQLNSQQFFNSWIEIVQSRKEHLLSIFRNQSEFTEHVKSNENSVLKEIAKKFGLCCFAQDYYSLDAVLYLEEDLVPNIKEGTTWLRDIRVAFEHENFFGSGLYKEVSHLLITNCDLKVLVTYPNGDEQPQLEYLHSIIKGSRQSKALSDNESFLIILGYETNFAWEGYVYKENNWQLLN